MAEVRCPSCGTPVPAEAGQQESVPVAGVVECPNCGAQVTLDKPGGRAGDDEARGAADVRRAGTTVGGEEGAPESFSGEEDLHGVMDELEDKPGGPRSGP
jgi:endogenous inhibitor of DNA gyrase (YacG/DUF329 family)